MNTPTPVVNFYIVNFPLCSAFFILRLTLPSSGSSQNRKRFDVRIVPTGKSGALGAHRCRRAAIGLHLRATEGTSADDLMVALHRNELSPRAARRPSFEMWSRLS